MRRPKIWLLTEMLQVRVLPGEPTFSVTCKNRGAPEWCNYPCSVRIFILPPPSCSGKPQRFATERRSDKFAFALSLSVHDVVPVEE